MAYTGLKPFFCYYGGKFRVAPHYPLPEYGRIIEPFAGAAGYSCRHAEHQVILYDVDPIICGLWDYLIHVSKADILRLPLKVSHVDELQISQEAKWLIGFWLNKGSTGPRKSPSKWARDGTRPNSFWGEVIRQRIAEQVHRIRHWKIFNASYASISDQKCTWFIDPPYAGKCGSIYRYKFTDYLSLGRFCRNRRGQVIVCERSGATWLPFKPFRVIRSTGGANSKGNSREVVWYN